MSADNGVYILKTKDNQIRVIETKSISHGKELKVMQKPYQN